jgi:hypothetical protein
MERACLSTNTIADKGTEHLQKIDKRGSFSSHFFLPFFFVYQGISIVFSSITLSPEEWCTEILVMGRKLRRNLDINSNFEYGRRDHREGLYHRLSLSLGQVDNIVSQTSLSWKSLCRSIPLWSLKEKAKHSQLLLHQFL